MIKIPCKGPKGRILEKDNVGYHKAMKERKKAIGSKTAHKATKPSRATFKKAKKRGW